VTGARWQMTLPLRAGTAWLVKANGVPCPFARSWVPRLTAQAQPLRGPVGWTCLRVVNLRAPRASGGSCRSGTAYFLWAVPPLLHAAP